MYIGNSLSEQAELHIHKALNLIEGVELRNCFVPKAKDIVIEKLEEALLWMKYEGRKSV
jgi:hypothetical protein